jgi:hypothetical protein
LGVYTTTFKNRENTFTSVKVNLTIKNTKKQENNNISREETKRRKSYAGKETRRTIKWHGSKLH